MTSTLRSRVFGYIRAHPGATVGEIAEALDVSLPATSNAVHSLSKDGALERTPESLNRRLGRWRVVPEFMADFRNPAPPKPAVRRVRRPNVDPPSSSAGCFKTTPCDLQQRWKTLCWPEAPDWRWNVR